MKKMIYEVVEKMKPIAVAKKISIKVDVPEISVSGNEFEIPDVFVILLDNAIKYSREGGLISIDGQVKKKRVEIRVTDAGVGIDKKDLPHIFERFYRADRARTKSDAGGYGLGLAIAKQIVDGHKGKISVKSLAEKSTTITVILPVG